eukprot:TRINITY_DN5885_c0_g1_i1.p1 TRINITY_DN5885_c0_g1~~TRINITY_DN5885_c0_g1_i1.p1  ORF type:complete len:119 (-),score=2.51 TRINITY_DN5885_c0_g1_i1:44-367(-)
MFKREDEKSIDLCLRQLKSKVSPENYDLFVKEVTKRREEAKKKKTRLSEAQFNATLARVVNMKISGNAKASMALYKLEEVIPEDQFKDLRNKMTEELEAARKASVVE